MPRKSTKTTKAKSKSTKSKAKSKPKYDQTERRIEAIGDAYRTGEQVADLICDFLRLF